jgi:hypothetical protein
MQELHRMTRAFYDSFLDILAEDDIQPSYVTEELSYGDETPASEVYN